MSDNINLRRIIAVRNASNFAPIGHMQSAHLAGHIFKIIGNEIKVPLFSSTDPCAHKTAAAIGKKIGVRPFISQYFLLNRYDDAQKMFDIIRYIAPPDAETVIVVTHDWSPSGLANYFSSLWRGPQVRPFICPVAKGIMVERVNTSPGAIITMIG